MASLAPLRAELRLQVLGVSPRDVVLRHNGRDVRTVRTAEGPVELALADFALEPGVNRFTLHSPEPARRLGTGRYQLRTFCVKESSIKVAAPRSAAD